MKPVPGRFLKIGIFLILTAIIAVVYILQQQSAHLKHTALFVAHTNDVLYNTEKVISAVRKNKVVLRDFVISGDKRHLQLL